MIHIDAEMQQKIELLTGMYRAVAELHQRITPENQVNFRIFAEGLVEQIRRLRAEIDEYLGIQEPVVAGRQSE